MKADVHVGKLLSQTERSFGRMQLWEQVKFLDKTLDQWEQLKKVSPRQEHKWSAKFWEMVAWFCASLTDMLEIYHRKLLSSKSERQPPNYARFLTRIHRLDEERTQKIMIQHPLAFTIVEEEWARWVQLVM